MTLEQCDSLASLLVSESLSGGSGGTWAKNNHYHYLSLSPRLRELEYVAFGFLWAWNSSFDLGHNSTFPFLCFPWTCERNRPNTTSSHGANICVWPLRGMYFRNIIVAKLSKPQALGTALRMLGQLCKIHHTSNDTLRFQQLFDVAGILDISSGRGCMLLDIDIYLKEGKLFVVGLIQPSSRSVANHACCQPYGQLLSSTWPWRFLLSDSSIK